jgi:hypothetical protein
VSRKKVIVSRKNKTLTGCKGLLLRPTQGPVMLTWPMLPIPGFELVVFSFNNRLDVYYMISKDEKDWVMQTNNPEHLEIAREKWRLAFTCGQA